MLPFKASPVKHKVAIITDSGLQVTYGEINDFSISLSHVIQHRCLVFCLTQNTPGSLIGYLSFVANNVVPALLDSKMDERFLAELIQLYQPQYIWLPNHRMHEFGHFQTVFTKYDYSLIKLGTKSCALHQDLAVLLTTSGSTGSSKFVRINYEALEENATAIATYLSLDDKERPITTLPMSYAFGLSVINSHVLKEATILLTSKTLMEKAFWNFLKNQKATSISGVPYTFEMLIKLQFLQMDLPALKTLTQAGGKMAIEANKAIVEYCNRTGKQFFAMYGQTEATARISYLPPQHALKKLGSIGTAIPGGELSLVDDTGVAILESDVVGQLVYKGKNVAMGYSTCGDDLKKGDENRGKLFTGDLARRDSDNFYFIEGRKKRIIKIYGNRINLDEVEYLLQEIASGCACTGKDDYLIAYVTDQTSIPEVEEYISKKMRIHPLAFSVRYSMEIPKNEAGKTIYHQMEQS